jgi:2-polyprenyl-3-methyl-5-hydroxy-6-metoxy-1,4-benzoquinol methylase
MTNNEKQLSDHPTWARDQEDAPLRDKRLLRPLIARIGYQLRKPVFRSATLRKLATRLSEAGGASSEEETARYWDNKLSATHFGTYLGGTLDVDTRNAVTAVLIRHYAQDCPSVLDIGCAGGTLVLALSSFDSYLGVDVSRYAIEQAERNPAICRLGSTQVSFASADIRSFRLDRSWDVIILNEVLYYLGVEDAVDQVSRYAHALQPKGVLVVSMKDDPKTHSIYRQLRRQYKWIGGLLWQRKATEPDYRVRINRERPATLVAVLQPP